MAKGKELDEENKEDFLKDDTKDGKKELTDIQQSIVSWIGIDDKITIPVLARKTKTSERTISRELKFLREELKVLSREGGRKEGHWVIIKK